MNTQSVTLLLVKGFGTITVELKGRSRQGRRRDLIFRVHHGRGVVVVGDRNFALSCLQDCSCCSDGLTGMSIIYQDLTIVQGILFIILTLIKYK